MTIAEAGAPAMKTPEEVIARHCPRWIASEPGLGSSNAEEILAALDVAGYAVVPKEPTGEMLAASGIWSSLHCRKIWDAMIQHIVDGGS